MSKTGKRNHLLSFQRPSARQKFRAIPPLLLGLSDSQGVGIGTQDSVELRIAWKRSSRAVSHPRKLHVHLFSSFYPLKPTRQGWLTCLQLCSCLMGVTGKSRLWMATSYTCPQRTLLMKDIYSSV